MQRSLPDYDAAGIAVFALSYDPVSVLAGFAEKQDITYPLLADAGSAVIRRLGLFNEHVFEQHAAFGIPQRDHHWGVAYPGVFLLDEYGVVTEKRFQQSYRERETGTAILEQGFGLTPAASGSQERAVGPVVTAQAHLDSPTYRLFQRRWLTVELVVEPGWHLYGEPIPVGYFPLQVTVAPVTGLVVGTLQGPEPRPFHGGGLDEQFLVYEGRVTVSVPLTFNQKVGDLTLAVTVQYQACSATTCLPPTTLTVPLALRAENLVDLDR